MKPQEITYNDIPLVLGLLVEKISALEEEIRNLMSDSKADTEKIIGGLFLPNEFIRLNDKRLYEGDNAPFKSYAAVYNAKNNGCPFTKNAGGMYRIKADKLNEWLEGPKMNRSKMYNL